MKMTFGPKRHIYFIHGVFTGTFYSLIKME